VHEYSRANKHVAKGRRESAAHMAVEKSPRKSRIKGSLRSFKRSARVFKEKEGKASGCLTMGRKRVVRKKKA